jgi:plastocyanin
VKSLTLTASSLLLGAIAAAGCTDDSGGGAGQAGSGGGGGQAGSGGGAGSGTGGQTGGSGGGGASSSGFMAVAPCNAEGSYVSNTTTVSFTGATTAAYTPNCLKVSAGASVTFTGDFSTHPLEPSARRGTLAGNPIMTTGALPDGGTSRSFTFLSPGFFAYYCDVHGPSDSGAGMVGVIWVQ